MFVSRETITGDPGIDPTVPLELRVEFTRMGRDNTLVRIIQGPYEPDVAGWHGEGWEKEMTRLADALRAQNRSGSGVVLTEEITQALQNTEAAIRRNMYALDRNEAEIASDQETLAAQIALREARRAARRQNAELSNRPPRPRDDMNTIVNAATPSVQRRESTEWPRGPLDVQMLAMIDESRQHLRFRGGVDVHGVGWSDDGRFL